MSDGKINQPSSNMREAVEALGHPELHPLSALRVQGAIKIAAKDLMAKVQRDGPAFEALRDAIPSAIPPNTLPEHLLVVCLSIVAQSINMLATSEAQTTGLHPVGLRRLLAGMCGHIIGDLSDQWTAKQYEEQENARKAD